MLHWRRYSEWAAVVRREHGHVSWLNMVRAILSGPVPREVWRHRMFVCQRCPILDHEMHACYKPLRDGRVLGCRCQVVMLALTAAPYPRGCYARQISDHEGWMSFEYPSRRAKLKAVWRFFFP